MKLKAVFFDMGGTLDTHTCDRKTGVRATAQIKQLLSRGGVLVRSSDEELYDLVNEGLKAYRRWRNVSYVELPPERVWREFVLKSYPTVPGQLDGVAEDLAYTVDTRYYQRRMRPEVPRVLELLNGMGLKLGIISNIQSRGQVPGDLNRYGIEHFFDPVVLSCEYGRRKPDPAIFHFAARQAGVPTSCCTHVGDRISRDVLGAKRAGFALVVQIRHEFVETEEPVEPRPDAIIDSIDELPKLLSQHAACRSEPGAVSSRSAGPRAFLFDAADTLYCRPNRGHYLQEFLSELGLENNHPDPDVLSTLREKAELDRIDIHSYRIRVLSSYGVQNPDDLAKGLEVLDLESQNIRFFPGVTETLQKLKEAGYLLGVVTNTVIPLHEKLRWFERAGIGSIWDCLISSKEVGFRKPLPEIYEAALKQLGIPAAQAVFVGHEAAELIGAKRVGLQTVAFNYEDGVIADAYLDKFEDLLPYAQSLQHE